MDIIRPNAIYQSDNSSLHPFLPQQVRKEKKAAERHEEVVKIYRKFEQQSQDYERYCMQLEDLRSWQALVLNERNRLRMIAEHKVSLAKRQQELKESASLMAQQQEVGLTYKGGIIQSYM